ncbi:unnamed protein product [Dovyalis caffra]|uniref:Uncharacterized protein n=1 Tax=Dovyalis caffra TaxID=77055 RepID=A0AAV1QZI7_9ROSI|nr:unnamed protein product [Dovyalis caffra]
MTFNDNGDISHIDRAKDITTNTLHEPRGNNGAMNGHNQPPMNTFGRGQYGNIGGASSNRGPALSDGGGGGGRDAFTDSAFKGNPAAVCLLEEAVKDEKWLQAVAAEFNMSETTDVSVTSNPRFRLRWFTPVAEVNTSFGLLVKLCGHATLAASHALFSNGLVHSNIIEFDTLSGILTAKKVPQSIKPECVSNGEAKESFLIELDFPIVRTTEFSMDAVSISKALDSAPIIDLKRTTTSDVHFGVIVSGVAPPESGFDFYSRFFCPKFGINEDPVCGSAHCALAPYWSKKLGKCDLMAYQASPRSGILDIHLDDQNQRVLLRGKAVTVMEGFLLVCTDTDANERKVTVSSTVDPHLLVEEFARIGKKAHFLWVPRPFLMNQNKADDRGSGSAGSSQLQKFAEKKRMKLLELNQTNIKMTVNDNGDISHIDRATNVTTNNLHEPRGNNGAMNWHNQPPMNTSVKANMVISVVQAAAEVLLPMVVVVVDVVQQ